MLSIGKVNNNEPIFFGGDLKHSVCTQISIILITLKFESERNSMRSHVNSMNPDITFDGHLFRTRNASIDLAIRMQLDRFYLRISVHSSTNNFDHQFSIFTASIRSLLWSYRPFILHINSRFLREKNYIFFVPLHFEWHLKPYLRTSSYWTLTMPNEASEEFVTKADLQIWTRLWLFLNTLL